jgi:hypothetical protein
MSRQNRVLIAILAAGALVPVSACRGEARTAASAPGAGAEATGRPAPVPAHPPTPLAGSVQETELVWSVPDGWVTEEPASAMRKAQYRLPPEAGDREGGECAVFYFGAGQGGDVRGNVERWAGQFQGPGGTAAKPAVTEVTAGGLTITRVEIKGRYTPSSMMTGGGASPAPRASYTLLGAIVPGARSNWFFRCTGPEKTMAANRGRFDALLASIRPAV